MIYYKDEDKNKYIETNKKALTIFIMFSILFVLLTIIFVLLNKKLGILISTIIESILSTFFFSYLICFIKIYFHNKRVILLYEKILQKEEKVDVVIEKTLDIITINQLQFIKILVKNKDKERIYYLYKELNINYIEKENKTLLISGNYIKGEL